MASPRIKEAPIHEIKEALLEKKPLPLGKTEFDEFFERIYTGALIPFEEGKEQNLKTSCKHTVANLVLHLGPTESVKEDAYFIHSLRKAAANEVAFAVAQEIKAEKAKALTASDDIPVED